MAEYKLASFSEEKKRVVTGSDGKAWKYSDKLNDLDNKVRLTSR